MTTKRNKPPLKVKMSFEEALARFAQTDPKEVKEALEGRSKKKDKSNTSKTEV